MHASDTTRMTNHIDISEKICIYLVMGVFVAFIFFLALAGGFALAIVKMAFVGLRMSLAMVDDLMQQRRRSTRSYLTGGEYRG